jgi:hypothetical protein
MPAAVWTAGDQNSSTPSFKVYLARNFTTQHHFFIENLTLCVWMVLACIISCSAEFREELTELGDIVANSSNFVFVMVLNEGGALHSAQQYHSAN